MKAKVLVVDDEVEFAATLSERLRLRNYDAKAVYSAEDAFFAAKRDAPDVILLDLIMPKMSGMDIFKAIKEITPDSEVILLTGRVDIDTVSEEIMMEDFDYIMKPLDIEELILKIDKALQRHGSKPRKKGI